MTNKERYKQAFSVLHTSDQFSVEVENMGRLNKKHNMKVAAAAFFPESSERNKEILSACFCR